MPGPDGAVLFQFLTLLLAILILVLRIGMLGWMRMKKEDREEAVQLADREEKRKRIALHGAQPGDVIVNDVSLEDIQGSWEMVSVGRNGNFAPPEVLQNAAVRFVIDGAAFFIEATNGTGTLKVDRHSLQFIWINAMTTEIHISASCASAMENLRSARVKQGRPGRKRLIQTGTTTRV